MTGARFITPAELESLMSQTEKCEFELLDVRSRSEFHSGHISHAVSMPVDELEKLSAYLPQGKKLVIYCRTGRRCLKALPLLTKKGHNEVLILEGGLEHWPGSLVTERSP
jgi:rhodanese-related sulfurtransferase